MAGQKISSREVVVDPPALTPDRQRTTVVDHFTDHGYVAADAEGDLCFAVEPLDGGSLQVLFGPRDTLRASQARARFHPDGSAFRLELSAEMKRAPWGKTPTL